MTFPWSVISQYRGYFCQQFDKGYNMGVIRRFSTQFYLRAEYSPWVMSILRDFSPCHEAEMFQLKYFKLLQQMRNDVNSHNQVMFVKRVKIILHCFCHRYIYPWVDCITEYTRPLPLQTPRIETRMFTVMHVLAVFAGGHSKMKLLFQEERKSSCRSGTLQDRRGNIKFKSRSK